MSDWIEWKGGECPVPAPTEVDVRLRDGTTIVGWTASFLQRGDDWWKHEGDANTNIVAFRFCWPHDTRIAALEQQVKTLREALEVFDAFLHRAVLLGTPGWFETEHDDRVIVEWNDVGLTMADWRRAARALAATEDANV